MYDTAKILSGLAIFLLVFSAPLWWNLATGAEIRAPEPKLPENSSACVLPSAEMRASHMELLNRWRDLSVRERDRVMTTADGRKFVRSLSRTCLGCHTDKSAFCDRCHAYTAVTPYCWNCHLIPPGGTS